MLLLLSKINAYRYADQISEGDSGWDGVYRQGGDVFAVGATALLLLIEIPRRRRSCVVLIDAVLVEYRMVGNDELLRPVTFSSMLPSRNI